MRRILHIVHGMNRGGIENFLMNVYRKINRETLQFDFLVHTKKKCAFDEEIETLGGRIYRIPSRREGICANAKALKSFFENHSDYEILEQHVSSLSYIKPLKTATKYNVRTRILHCQSTNQGGPFVHKLLHHLNRLSLSKYASHLFVCSNKVASWIFGNRNFNKKDFIIVKNGIDIDNFSFKSSVRRKIRQLLGVDGRFVIGHVGRFSYPKNHDYLIDIFESFSKNNTESVLLLVGDGKLRENIENKVKKLGLANRVIFTGIVEDISSYYQAMDVFVFPSIYEGFPLSILEAQASGLPCVISSNITDEVKLNQSINSVSLEASIKTWCKEIQHFYSKKVDRTNSARLLREAGYDIRDTVNFLQKFYSEV